MKMKGDFLLLIFFAKEKIKAHSPYIANLSEDNFQKMEVTIGMEIRHDSTSAYERN